jgi:CysZ protein
MLKSNGTLPMPNVLQPIVRAFSQFDDTAFTGVLLRSIAWSILSFIALYFTAVGIVHHLLALHGWLAWGADLLGSIAASFLALWLFLPVAAAIGALYFDRIALAVEHRFYPWLPPPRGASLLEQAWDAVVLALRVLALNCLGLILTLLLPGLGLVLGWIIAAYAIGRGLFVAVAMRRMPRAMAESLYRANRGTVLLQGAVLALSAYVPVANLLVPVVGVAAMVHVLDMALISAETAER